MKAKYMKKAKRVAAMVVLAVFLFNNAVYGVEFNLATGSAFDDLRGIEHKDAVNIELWLTACLASLEDNGYELDKLSIKDFVHDNHIIERGLLRGDTIFCPKGVSFRITNIKPWGDGRNRVEVKIKDNKNGLRTYYAVFSGVDDVVAHPKGKSEGRTEKDKKAMKEYKAHQRSGDITVTWLAVDEFIKKHIRKGAFAEIEGRAVSLGWDKKYPDRKRPEDYILPELWKNSKGHIDRFLSLFCTNVDRTFKGKNIVCIRVAENEDLPAMEIDGVPVEVENHTSQNAAYFFVAADIYDYMIGAHSLKAKVQRDGGMDAHLTQTSERQQGEEERAVTRIVLGGLHEAGVLHKLRWKIVGRKPENAIDRAYEYVNRECRQLDDADVGVWRISTYIRDNVGVLGPELLKLYPDLEKLKGEPVNLDHLENRDLAGSPDYDAGAAKTFNSAGITGELLEIMAQDEFPIDSITLEGLLKYLEENRPNVLGAKRSYDEKMAILCLVFVGKDYKKIRKKALTKSYLGLLRIVRAQGLTSEARARLRELEDAILLPGRRTALVLANSSAERINNGALSDARYVELFSTMFKPIIDGSGRKFLAKWEKDYFTRLSHMSAGKLQEEWDRISILRDGRKSTPLYRLPINDFIYDAASSSHPAYLGFVTETDWDRDYSEKEQSRIILAAAKMNIYFNWLSRHLDPDSPGDIRAIYPEDDYSLDYIVKNLRCFRRKPRAAFERHVIFKALTETTYDEAFGILGLRGPYPDQPNTGFGGVQIDPGDDKKDDNAANDATKALRAATLNISESAISGIEFDKDMKEYTTLRIGGKALAFAEPASIEELCNILTFTHQNNISVNILGAGSNTFFGEYVPALVISMKKFNSVEIEGELVRVGAGIGLPDLANKVKEHELSGLEFASVIPGTAGGAVVMNAGFTADSIDRRLAESGIDNVNFVTDNIVEEVKVITLNGELKTLTKDEIEFGTKHSVFQSEPMLIYEVTFRLKKRDKEDIARIMEIIDSGRLLEPKMWTSSLGSVFRPQDESYIFEGEIRTATWFVEQVDVKGWTEGDIAIHDRDQEVLYNKENGTQEDYIALAARIYHAVYTKFGVKLIVEVKSFPDGMLERGKLVGLAQERYEVTRTGKELTVTAAARVSSARGESFSRRQIDKLEEVAGTVGKELSVQDCVLFTAPGMYKHGKEYAEDQVKYRGKFHIKRLMTHDPGQVVRRIERAVDADLDPKKIVLQISAQFLRKDGSEKALEELREKFPGIRFVPINTEGLLSEGKAERAKYRRFIYNMMLLSRAPKDIADLNRNTSLWGFLFFWVESHIQDGNNKDVNKYIEALVTGNISLSINDMLSYKPIERYKEPDPDRIAEALLSA